MERRNCNMLLYVSISLLGTMPWRIWGWICNNTKEGDYTMWKVLLSSRYVWFADSNNSEYCSTMNYDEEACELKISNNGGIVRGDFSRHGYQHTWSAIDAWLFVPPEDLFRPGPKDNYALAIPSASDCARFCSNQDAKGGIWNSTAEACTCHYYLVCFEPCIDNEVGVTFAVKPYSDFDVCEKSLCDPDCYFDVWEDWCINTGLYNPANATCPWRL